MTGGASAANQQRWFEIVSGRDRRPAAFLARAVLLPLAWLYGGIIAGYRGLYAVGWLPSERLRCAVVTVGNLTVGGTGKSTTVRWLARALASHGVRAAVLSYGYHGKAKRARPGYASKPGGGRRDAVTVVSDGVRALVPVAESGDEPRMLADDLPGVPVLAAPRRVLAGRLAVERFGVDLVLMDDGFQYWRLQKDFEIVLVDATNPFGYGHLLPRGLLRESPRVLSRADVVLLMNSHRLDEAGRRALQGRLKRLAPRALHATGGHRPTGLHPIGRREERVPVTWIAGRQLVALSSLGNPEGFEQMLRDLGAVDVASRRFADHYQYSRSEAERAIQLRESWEAVVTTAKDAPKLAEALGADGSLSSVWVLEVDLCLETGASEILERIIARIGQREQEASSPS